VRLETRDHTPAFAKWEAGEISLDEIPDTAGANRLQRAVGRGGEADVAWLPARAGWSWLIISDGVYKAMRLDELGQVMQEPTARHAVEAIRSKVLERGPDDNFTAVLVRALPDATPTPVLHDRTLPMASTPRSAAPAPDPHRHGGGSSAALGLAIVALLASLAALWMFWHGQNSGVDRSEELRQLRADVDSLGAVVDQLRSPFGGPTLGTPVMDSSTTDSAAAAPEDTLP
jgi:hypothetical protein